MERLKRNINFFNYLNKADKKRKKIIIKAAKKDQIYSICDCVLNILKGNLPLKEEDKKKLYKRRYKLRKLLEKSKLENKKTILQEGGFLQVLLPALITSLSTIIGNLIKNE